jgi:hypothetical protein
MYGSGERETNVRHQKIQVINTASSGSLNCMLDEFQAKI